mmetsp:Transcript_18917/g.52103  ORF Transcript_18917/g.52103 Transcript_18917/m.52103 type:complete len:263 (+) Transcript_18917:704-1492(+)
MEDRLLGRTCEEDVWTLADEVVILAGNAPQLTRPPREHVIHPRLALVPGDANILQVLAGQKVGLPRELRDDVVDVQGVPTGTGQLEHAKLHLYEDLSRNPADACDPLEQRDVRAVHAAVKDIAVMAESVDPQFHPHHAEQPAPPPIAHVEDPQVRDDHHVLYRGEETEMRERQGGQQEHHGRQKRRDHAGKESLAHVWDQESVGRRALRKEEQRHKEQNREDNVGQYVHERHLRGLRPGRQDALAVENAQAMLRYVHQWCPA